MLEGEAILGYTQFEGHGGGYIHAAPRFSRINYSHPLVIYSGIDSWSRLISALAPSQYRMSDSISGFKRL